MKTKIKKDKVVEEERIDPLDIPTFVSMYKCTEHKLINLTREALEYHRHAVGCTNRV